MCSKLMLTSEKNSKGERETECRGNESRGKAYMRDRNSEEIHPDRSYTHILACGVCNYIHYLIFVFSYHGKTKPNGMRKVIARIP